MVAQTPSVPRFSDGCIADAVKRVAEPNFAKATTATTQSRRDGNPDAERAEIAEPLADVETDDVEREREADTEESKRR